MTVGVRPIEVEVPAREKSVADVLRHAARIIEERGWSDSDLVTDDGRFCAWGAIAAATGGMPTLGGVLPSFGEEDEQPALIALADYVNPRWIIAGGAVGCWNDYEAGSAEVVIAALRAAADAWEAERV